MNEPLNQREQEAIQAMAEATAGVLRRFADRTGTTVNDILDLILQSTGAPPESPEVAEFRQQQEDGGR